MSWIHARCDRHISDLELSIRCLTDEIKAARADLEHAQNLNRKLLEISSEQTKPTVIPPEPKEPKKPKVTLRTWMKNAEEFEQ